MKIAKGNMPFTFIKNEEVDLDQIHGESVGFWKAATIAFMKNKAAVVSIILLFIIIILAIIGPYTGFYGADGSEGTTQNAKHALVPPKIPGLAWTPFFDGVTKTNNGEEIDKYEELDIDGYYYFGTDDLGRDLWVRIWKGTRISLAFGLVATIIDLLIGVTFGGFSGYFGGKVDLILSRIMEVISCVPSLILIIILVVVLGPGVGPMLIAIAITGWVGMARMVRGQIRKLKEQEFVYASQTLGASHTRIVYKHLLPNTYPVIIVWLMFTIPGAIFTEAFLAFLGLGIPAPNASLGTLINDGRNFMTVYPYVLMIPTTILAIIMISFNLIANGLRDAFDPKTRSEH